MLALLLQACATASGIERSAKAGHLALTLDSIGMGADFTPSPRRPAVSIDDGAQRARDAEAEHALGQIEALLSAESAVGARWQFRYWAENGALTLLSLRREARGDGRASSMDRRIFAPDFARDLPTLLGLQPREVTLTLERGHTGWAASLDSESRVPPPEEARMLPTRRTGVPHDTYQQLVAVARALVRIMEVPAKGRATLRVEVAFEDARVKGWRPGEFALSGETHRLPASEQASSAIIHALHPFTSALGARTVRLELEGVHPHGTSAPHWTVVKAETLQPPPPPKEMEDFAAEYREMHERILHEWREEARDSAVLFASLTAEQLAWWFVGGFVAQRAVVLFKASAPTIASVLSKGGTHAVRWFRALLIRMSPAERAALQQLWLKVETRGLDALTVAERAKWAAWRPSSTAR